MCVMHPHAMILAIYTHHSHALESPNQVIELQIHNPDPVGFSSGTAPVLWTMLHNVSSDIITMHKLAYNYGMHKCIYVRTYMHACACVCVCMYVCMHSHVSVHVCA